MQADRRMSVAQPRPTKVRWSESANAAIIACHKSMPHVNTQGALVEGKRVKTDTVGAEGPTVGGTHVSPEASVTSNLPVLAASSSASATSDSLAVGLIGDGSAARRGVGRVAVVIAVPAPAAVAAAIAAASAATADDTAAAATAAEAVAVATAAAARGSAPSPAGDIGSPIRPGCPDDGCPGGGELGSGWAVTRRGVEIRSGNGGGKREAGAAASGGAKTNRGVASGAGAWPSGAAAANGRGVFSGEVGRGNAFSADGHARGSAGRNSSG